MQVSSQRTDECYGLNDQENMSAFKLLPPPQFAIALKSILNISNLEFNTFPSNNIRFYCPHSRFMVWTDNDDAGGGWIVPGTFYLRH